jgi:DNA-binding transcriptional ArsR family regulator
MHMNADNVNTEPPESASVELAVEVFSMLADATRVRIILALRNAELPVNSVAKIVGKSPASVSQHLAKLRLARIVRTRNEGTSIFYRLANEHASTLVNEAVFQAEHSLSSEPPHHRSTPSQHLASPDAS